MNRFQKYIAVVTLTASLMTVGLNASDASTTSGSSKPSNPVVSVFQKAVNEAISLVTGKATNPSPGTPSLLKLTINTIQQNGGVINTIANVSRYATGIAFAAYVAVTCFFGENC